MVGVGPRGGENMGGIALLTSTQREVGEHTLQIKTPSGKLAGQSPLVEKNNPGGS